MKLRILLLLSLTGLAGPLTVHALDMENGEEINEVCAGCHGEYGQGDRIGV